MRQGLPIVYGKRRKLSERLAVSSLICQRVSEA